MIRVSFPKDFTKGVSNREVSAYGRVLRIEHDSSGMPYVLVKSPVEALALLELGDKVGGQSPKDFWLENRLEIVHHLTEQERAALEDHFEFHSHDLGLKIPTDWDFFRQFWCLLDQERLQILLQSDFDKEQTEREVYRMLKIDLQQGNCYFTCLPGQTWPDLKDRHAAVQLLTAERSKCSKVLARALNSIKASAGEATELGKSRPDPYIQGLLKEGKHREAVDAFIEKIEKETGRKITRDNVWQMAGYTDPTEGQRWQRNDKRTNKTADLNIKRVLSYTPDEVVSWLEIHEK